MGEIYRRCLQKLEEKGITGEYLIAPDMQFKPLSEKGREEILALLRKMEYTPITKEEAYQSLPYISIQFSNGVEIGFVEDFLQIYFFDRKEEKGETCRVKDREKFARELDEILSIERKI